MIASLDSKVRVFDGSKIVQRFGGEAQALRCFPFLIYLA